LERFYNPIEGQIKIGSYELKDLNLKWLRSQISIVSQEPILFDATIGIYYAVFFFFFLILDCFLNS
jgi:ABC-type multidrug transport system fused ATPase/permease subunit